MNSLDLSEIENLSREPEDDVAFDNWVQQNEIVSFLERECLEDNIVVCASLRYAFINTVLVPRFERDPATIQKLLNWNSGVDSGWCLGGPIGKDKICKPMDNWGKLYETGEPILFLRSFHDVPGRQAYYELSQPISQVLNVHHLAERNAWCDLNRQGDIDEIVKIHKLEHGTVISFRRDRLEEYAAAGCFTLVRMFDFTRFRSGSFSGWHDTEPDRQQLDHSNVFGQLSRHGKIGSYSRGVQILDIKSPQLSAPEDQPKQYATFIAHDWRHETVAEFSCAPDQLSNYFQPTEHPFETSPAFFRPEVLSKYKADQEKYIIEHRSISCRGSWYLKAFGWNDANQVFAYLGYLSNLPHEEQLHWKQFNEPPKASLPASVIATDFKGEFSDEYEPLSSLKHKLDGVQSRQVGWWTLRNVELRRKVHYPLTDSRSEWLTELMNLDKLLVEGLNEKWLRNKAKTFGRNPKDQLRALKLLEECLVGAGFDDDHAKELMECWHEVHNLRSLEGHASASAGRESEQKARNKNGNLLAHFKDLCTACDESLEVIIKAIEQ